MRSIVTDSWVLAILESDGPQTAILCFILGLVHKLRRLEDDAVREWNDTMTAIMPYTDITVSSPLYISSDDPVTMLSACRGSRPQLSTF
jgi:hypothetical protein